MEKNIENDLRSILGLKEGEKIPAQVEQLFTSTKRAADRANIPFGRPQELLILCVIAYPSAFVQKAEQKAEPEKKDAKK